MSTHHKDDMTTDSIPFYNMGNFSMSNSSVDNDGSHDQKCKVFDFVLEAILMGTLCILGFVGNTLSFIVLRRHKSKSPTPTLFIALGVADTLFLVTVVILRVAPTVLSYFNMHLPPIYAYFGVYLWPEAMMAETATIWLTVLVTINRYVSVCRPLHAATMCSKRTTYRHVVAITLFTIIYNVPRFFEYRVATSIHPLTNETIVHSALTSFGSDKIYRILYGNVMYFLIIYVIPLGTLVIFNTKLTMLLKRSRRERGELLATGGGRTCGNGIVLDSTKQEQDITLMLIGVVLVFIICKSPALLTHALLSVIPQTERECPAFYFYYSRISDLMVVTSSSTNFIVYCFCSRKFRHILSLVICRRTKSIMRKSSSKMYTSYTSVNDLTSNSVRRHRSRLIETGNSFLMRERDSIYNRLSTNKKDRNGCSTPRVHTDSPSRKSKK